MQRVAYDGAWRAKMNIAIYDLDKTVTRRSTFTPFLLFFARRHKPLRLAALPVWIGALVGYWVGLYDRKPLKQFGIALFMGRQHKPEMLACVTSEFASDVVMRGLQPGAVKAIECDRRNGSRLVLATAAPEFYAKEIGARLGFDVVVATRHVIGTDSYVGHHIDGENCYGGIKLKMIEAWLRSQKLDRSGCDITVYSDHVSDAPLLDWADRAYLVNPSVKLQKLAAAKNWHVRNFASDDAKSDR